jgi:copper chaperone CopZ
MKNLIVTAIATLAFSLAVRAGEVSAKITDVHLCCPSCVKGVKKAVEGVQGAEASANQDEGTVTLTGPDAATVQKAADALVAAGYFGKSSDPAIKLNAETGAKGKNVKSLEVENVHLCCGKCVKAVNTALGDVKGVTGNTAAKGVKSFTVNGDFNDQEVFSALQKNGLTGQAGK